MLARSSHRLLSHRRSRSFVGSVIALTVLAGLAYRHLLFWDPSAPGLPNASWFFFGMSDTAPQIVFAIAAFLLYRRRRGLARTLGSEGSTLPALPLLGASLALFLWAQYVAAPDLILISFLLFCLGSTLLLFGVPFTREISLPVFFLAFALPLPAVLINQIVFPMQLWNAELVALLMNGVGIPAVQEGDMLYFADQSLEIIETCSGLRSIVVLTMLAVGLVCYFPARRLHLTLLVASAFLIACVVNVARILTLARYPEAEESASHALQGAVLFLCGSAAVCAIDALLRRGEGNRTGQSTAQESSDLAAAPWSGDSFRTGRAVGLAILLVSMLGASIWSPRWSPSEPPEPPKIELPKRLGYWKAIESPKLDSRFLGSVRFRAKSYRRYQRGDETVSVFVGYDDRLRRSRSLLSPKNAVPGAGWHVEERAPVELAPIATGVESVSARSGPNRILSFYWYEGTERLALEILRAWLATDQSSFRRPGGAWVVRLSTAVEPTREGRQRAEARLRGLAELLGRRGSFLARR
jgi:EpsI family protein